MSDSTTAGKERLERLLIPKTSINDTHYLEYKFLFKDLEDAIRKYAKGDVLDIGCGNKPYECFFDKNVTSYTGCDIAQSSGNRVDIISPATAIPLPDNSKDTIFSTQVIEHVADHRKFMSETQRILKKGGYAIISGPMVWEHHEEPYDFFRFTKYGFEWLLKENGLTPIEITPNGGKWALVGQLTMSNMLSSFEKKTPVRRFFRLLYFIFRIKWIVNLFFSFLDKADKDYRHTLNFVVVARKD